MTLKIGWPWKTIGHLFCIMSSFVYHFKVIGEFELELQSGNAQFGSKSAIFCPMWPRNLMDDLENKANLRDLIAATGLVILLKLDSNHRFFSPCDLEIWWMTPKNNLAPLLCYFKLFASFVAIGEFKLELQSGNAQSGSNSTLFRAMWPWNLTNDLENKANRRDLKAATGL